MLPIDALLKGAAALVALVIGALVLSASPRDRAARWLGVFLGLIAANQIAEVFRAVLEDPMPAFRIATIAASLDPIALALFATTLAGRPLHGWRFLLIATPGALLALSAGWILGPVLEDFPSRILPIALSAYTFAVYLYVALLAHDRLVKDARDPAFRALAFASLLVVPPPLVSVFDDVLFAFEGSVQHIGAMVLTIETLLVVAVAAFLLLRSRLFADPVARQPIIGGFATMLAIFAAAKVFAITSLVGAIPHDVLKLERPELLITGQASASIRWLIFGALLSTAIFRHRALGASMLARRRAARGLVALSFVLAGLLLITLVSGGSAPPLRWTEGAVLLVAVALSQSFRRVVDRVAARVYGVPMAGDVASAHDVYRRAAGEAASVGRGLVDDPELARLRDELGIDSTSAAALERLAVPSEGPLRPGALAAGRYRIERYVGRGGGGRIFLARDTLLRRDVAIKEAVSASSAKAALREARAASRVQHPGVIAVFDVVAREESALIVTEYVEGGTLAERVAERGPLAGADGVRVAVGVLDAVAAIHEEGLVHGDLKPANVLLDASGSPKVADFGLARSADATTTLGPDAGGGTPGFMAPEQRRGRAPTPRSDVYSLGLLLRRTCVVAALEPVLERAIADDPAARWGDAREMLAAARAALQRQ